MKPVKTWILIADGARARILLNEGPGKGLKPALDHEFATVHAPTRELGSDRPGRVHDRFGPGRHAMEPPADWHEYEKQTFAAEIARLLEEEAQKGSFDRLVVVAPPKTLGELRRTLGRAARDRL